MNSVVNQGHCPACKTGKTTETIELETFPYGEEGTGIEVKVPVIRCQNCDFAYTDQRAEEARHAAVCAQIGLLAPSEIKRIRTEVLGMSRAAFHAAYGLSSASVERWEKGQLFQGEAADTLLRALRNPIMARDLDRRAADSTEILERTGGDNVIWMRFPSLGSKPKRAEDALVRSQDFNLHIQVN